MMALTQSLSLYANLPSIAAGIGIVGAFLAAIMAYRKAKPEATAIIVDAAKDIVILQKGELNRLQESLELAQKRIATLEEENKGLRERLSREEKKLKEMEAKVDELIKRQKYS